MHARAQAMKTRIIRIGNSYVIRIPDLLLEETGLRGNVEISALDHALIIRPARKPREGWAAAFREMSRRGDDALLDDAPPSLSSWGEDDWEW
jgi:antitoxin MazE